MFPNLPKAVDYYSDSVSNLTLRKCNYYKNTGKMYREYLFYSYVEFISIIPKADKPGLDEIKLTEKQVAQLIKIVALVFRFYFLSISPWVIEFTTSLMKIPRLTFG